MSQPASAQQTFFYYVVYRATSPGGGGWVDGTSEMALNQPITCYENVTTIEQVIRSGEPAWSGWNVQVNNWILLRTEPAPPAQESA